MASNTDGYSVHLLHNRGDLLELTALLINDEWPRSLSARLLSISDGVDALPCSVVMTRRKHGETGGNRGEEVIGHARLMPVAGKKGAAFVETVVVARRLRGCGLGRRIMEVAESHAAEMNYRSVHLSTHDKVSFYSHLGYVSGPKVSPLRKCVANLTNEEAKSLIIGLETGSVAAVETDSNHIDTAPDTVAVAPPPSAVAPPPPPPPPKLLKSSQFKETETLTWMMKHLEIRTPTQEIQCS